jgi:predicted DCC family thiol-disulfide oxidoreductase YuxK
LTTDGPSLVFYDRDCGFCKWSVAKILALDRSKRLRALPIQSEEGERLLEAVDPEVRLDSWHLVSDGKLFSGGAVAEPLVRLLPFGRPLAVIFGAFPGFTESAYRYVAGHRDRWARMLHINADRELRRR